MQLMRKNKETNATIIVAGAYPCPKMSLLIEFHKPDQVQSHPTTGIRLTWTNIHLAMSNQDHIPESKSKKHIDIKVCGHKPILFCIFMIGLLRITP